MSHVDSLIREPLILGKDKTYGQITTDIVRNTEGNPPREWWIAFSIALVGLMLYVVAVSWTIFKGIGVWGLQNRALAGCNARFRFWENKKDDLYAGIGLFYEYEKWNPSVSAFAFAQDSLEVVYRYIPRLNLTAKTAVQLKEGIDLSASSFVQFPMNDRFNHFLNPRWFIDLNLFMAVTKHLSIQVHYDHNFDSYRPLPIDNWYYNFNIGFQLKW
jgi:hypothetical protein